MINISRHVRMIGHLNCGRMNLNGCLFNPRLFSVKGHAEMKRNLLVFHQCVLDLRVHIAMCSNDQTFKLLSPESGWIYMYVQPLNLFENVIKFLELNTCADAVFMGAF